MSQDKCSELVGLGYFASGLRSFSMLAGVVSGDATQGELRKGHFIIT